MRESEYQIVYSLQRRYMDEEDYTEIGFGLSGGWTEPDTAGHMINAAVQNFDWETEGDMPDPLDIKRELEEVRDE